ncbi:FAD-dependent monooxygenase [Saccharopolyspora sp. NPDC003752]
MDLRYGQRRKLDELDADLVIIADGVSSQSRTDHAADFGATVDVAGGLYLWAGTDFALEAAIFAPVTTAHGTFVTHAYPYATDRSTVLIETDEATWRAAGFDTTTNSTPLTESDTTALAYLQDAFAEHLHGHQLIGNRTRWLRFRTVHCERWTRGNAVLLGDAAHTAHYSIGSGTKLAMEDAIALRNAVAAAPDLPTALATYEQERRPQVQRLQELARRSRLWWDSFPRRTHLPVDRLMLVYMSRAGNVGLERFAGANPRSCGGVFRSSPTSSPRTCPPNRSATGCCADRCAMGANPGRGASSTPPGSTRSPPTPRKSSPPRHPGCTSPSCPSRSTTRGAQPGTSW